MSRLLAQASPPPGEPTVLAITTLKLVGAIVLLAGLLVLSLERYGGNLIERYHRWRNGRRSG